MVIMVCGKAKINCQIYNYYLVAVIGPVPLTAFPRDDGQRVYIYQLVSARITYGSLSLLQNATH